MKSTRLKSSEILLKLTKLLMKNGKKKKILKRVTSSLQKFSQNKEAYSGFCMLTSMFYKIKPLLETVKVRKGSKYYDVPYYIKPQRSISILLRWSVKSIKKHLEKSLEKKIQREFKELSLSSGSTFKESKQLRQKVATNIMFSHYRWK